jgi:multiple sugar transport system ATP-binding protein
VAEIRLEGIAKSYGEVTVVRGLDLTIGDGEFFTFVGPSGCGKSTILGMIAGLEAVNEGRLFFDGADVTHLSPRERDVAMVFQSYALYPHMTVSENIAFPLRMRKTPKKTVATEVARMLSLLGLSGLDRRKPAELSGGQRQRVALARALVRKPKVFLLDEPLSNLDAQLRIGMRAEIKKLQRELQITTVFVTHDQGEAMSLSDRMAVLHEGAVQQCGPPLEVYNSPATRFVGSFIGSPPMNHVEATVGGTDPFSVDCNGFSLVPARGETLPAQVGQPIVLGIRPDDVMISREEPAPSGKGTVSLVEPAGPFDWVDVTWGRTMVKGKAAVESRLRPGEEVFIKVLEERIVLFDKSSGRRIGGRQGP